VLFSFGFGQGVGFYLNHHAGMRSPVFDTVMHAVPVMVQLEN
jgi:hypothetical protein